MPIARNSLYVLLGSAAPMVAAIVALPVLVRAIGVERLGVLSLVWIILGYASVLDLGLGRAVTQATASCLSRREADRVPGIFWSAAWMQGALGVCVGLVLVVVFVGFALKLDVIPPSLAGEVRGCVLLCGVSIPVIMMTSSVIGVLCGAQRFDIVSAIQAPAAFLQYMLPLLIILWRQDLPSIVLGLLATRWISGAILFAAAARTVPRLLAVRRLRLDECRTLIRFGGWVTVSSVTSPLLVYLDRFLLGALVAISAVAYYAVPADMVVRLAVIPSSLATALFPVFSGLPGSDNEGNVGSLFAQAVKTILLLLGLPVACLIALGPDLIDVWMGLSFRQASGVALQILLVGLLANGVAYIPSALLQAYGRPDLVAKLQLVELPVFATIAYGCISLFGVTGAAAAWTLRVGFDAVALVVMSKRVIRGVNRGLLGLRVFESVGFAMLLMLIAGAIGHAVTYAAYRVFMTGVLLVVAAGIAWTLLLTDDERAAVLRVQTLFARRA